MIMLFQYSLNFESHSIFYWSSPLIHFVIAIELICLKILLNVLETFRLSIQAPYLEIADSRLFNIHAYPTKNVKSQNMETM